MICVTVTEFDEAVRKKVARNIRKMRTGSGWTVEHLADIVGVSWHTVYKWEHARMSPSLSNMLWMCKQTGWKVADILGGNRDGQSNDGNR